MNKRKEIIPNNLKEYRIKTDLTQKQVAELIGANNQERISHWEKGNNVPNMVYLIKVAKYTMHHILIYMKYKNHNSYRR